MMAIDASGNAMMSEITPTSIPSPINVAVKSLIFIYLYKVVLRHIPHGVVPLRLAVRANNPRP